MPKQKKKTTAKQVKELKALKPGNPGESKKTANPGDAVEGEVVDNPNGKDRYGRPTVMTEDVKKLLLDAFTWGCSNREASLHAGIAYSTLELYLNKDPDFKERCEELKESPTLLARGTLVKSIRKSPYYALKYLERKKSDEFSIRVRQTIGEPEPLTPEEEAELNDVINDCFNR